MRNTLLSAVASVAFIATGVVAQAQENQKREQNPAAERVEPKAPAAQTAPRQNSMKSEAAPTKEAPRAAEGEHKEMPKAAESERKEMPKAAEGERKEAPKAAEGQHKEMPKAAEGEHKEMPKSAEGEHKEMPKSAEGERKEMPKSAEGERKEMPKSAEGERKEQMRPASNEMQRQGQPNERTGANDRDRNAPRTAEHRGPARVKGNIKVSSEHATRISEILSRNARRSNVNVSIRVGERVPEGVEIEPLPTEVIALAPEYRGYDYFVENDEIVFVSPESHEIVGSIDYDEGRAASEETTTRVAGARPCPVEN